MRTVLSKTDGPARKVPHYRTSVAVLLYLVLSPTSPGLYCWRNSLYNNRNMDGSPAQRSNSFLGWSVHEGGTLFSLYSQLRHGHEALPPLSPPIQAEAGAEGTVLVRLDPSILKNTNTIVLSSDWTLLLICPHRVESTAIASSLELLPDTRQCACGTSLVTICLLLLPWWRLFGVCCSLAS